MKIIQRKQQGKREQVVSYFRTSSTTNVGEDKDSRKRQELACSQFASFNKMEVVAEFYDAGVQGKDEILTREGFAQLLAFCEVNSIKTILFENATRFSRDLITQETGYRILSSQGFNLISVDSPKTFVEDSPTSTMIRQIMGVFAQFEKDSVVQKLKGGRDRKKAINKDKGILTLKGAGKVEGRRSMKEINPTLASCAKKLNRKPRNGKRLSLRQISSIMFNQGFSTARGNTLPASQIKTLLDS